MADNDFIAKAGISVDGVNLIDGSGNWLGTPANLPGAQGTPGAQGPQGAQGTNSIVAGAQGVDGTDGPQGAQGVQGSPGAQGVIGTRGPQGPQGAQGFPGLAGSGGAQGPQGVQGTAGPQGFQGVQGPAGPQGAQGRQGAQGPQGFPGLSGPQGVQGRQGAAGAQGAQGTGGPQGPQGRQGAAGAQGTAGAQGPQGPQGFQGPQGTAATTASDISFLLSLGVNTTAGLDGTITTTGDITADYSDRRLKNIIGPIGNSLQRITSLDSIEYEQNKLAESIGVSDRGKQIGLIAQQIEEVLPEVVTIAPIDANRHGHSISGDKYLTIMYSKIIPLLVQALKEQHEQIEVLKSRL